MADLDLARLKALAEKATKGPWAADIRGRGESGAWVEDISSPSEKHMICWGHDYDDYGGMKPADADYIAACSPDVVLSLIARLEKIEQHCEEWIGADLLSASLAAEVLRLLREDGRE